MTTSVIILFAIVIPLVIVEYLYPFVRYSTENSPGRIANHFALLALNQITALTISYIFAKSFSFLFENTQWLPLDSLGLSGFSLIVCSILILDLSSYLRHRLMHLPLLWRAHQVHHSDKVMDWSTEWRFHPFETIISMIVRIAVIVVFALPGESVSLFGMIALTIGLIQHANIELPERAETILSKLLVTPSLHRVHHANNPDCFNSNFAVIFILWDKLFTTYKHPQREQSFGIPTSSSNKLKDLLLEPFNKSN